MRSHPDINKYCGMTTDEIEHGTHYIVDGRCSKCDERKTPTNIMGRCSEETVCGPCQICSTCEAEEKRNLVLANPTADEIEKAIPYSTDILKDFTRIKDAAQR